MRQIDLGAGPGAGPAAYLTLDDDNLLTSALKDPGGFVGRLSGRATLDEIRRAPKLLLAIKRSVDEAIRPGWFLLTGSANLLQLPDLRFWHYRDKDQVEVDVVITRGREVWGVEVRAAMTLQASDGRGLKRHAGSAGKDFRGRVVLYDGHLMMPLESDPQIHAVPLEWFWQQ